MPSRSPKRRRPETLLLVLLAVAPLAGCRSTLSYGAPNQARAMTAALERNYHTLDSALYAGDARVSFRFRDEDGRVQRLPNQSATLIFEHPNCLYFDIKNDTIGSIARIGSNDSRYWLWVALPEMRKLWWGTWDALQAGDADQLVVPPDQLLDALLLGPPQRSLGAGPRPLLMTEAGRPRLVYQRRDGRNWPYVAREIFVQPGGSVPTEIRDYDSGGNLVMRALLSDYRPVTGAGPGGPQTPRRYVMHWPATDAELRLDLSEVRYRNRDIPFCDFPERFSGEVVPLDRSTRGAAAGFAGQ